MFCLHCYWQNQLEFLLDCKGHFIWLPLRPNKQSCIYRVVYHAFIFSFSFVLTEVPNCQSSFWKAEKFYHDNTESKFGLFSDLVFYMLHSYTYNLESLLSNEQPKLYFFFGMSHSKIFFFICFQTVVLRENFNCTLTTHALSQKN